MKKLSHWASRNVILTRIILTFLKSLLFALAYFTGTELYKLKIFLPSGNIYFISLICCLAAIVFYPDKKRKRFSYARQKICDAIIPACAFLVITTAVNNAEFTPGYSPVYGSDIVKKPTAAEILASGRTKKMLTRTEKRILRREFYKQLKIYTVAKVKGDEKTAGAAWKIALTIVLAVGAIMLLAAGACSLACNGSEAAAVLLLVIGVGGVALLMIAIIKRIRRGPPPPTEVKVE